MASIFTQIINRNIPAYIVAEDEYFIAFLDIHPLAKGHTLVVPKVEVDYIFDLEDPWLNKMLVFAKKVAKGMKQAIPCLRIGFAAVGLEVPHTHLHLIPLNSAYDIDFRKKPLSYTPEEMKFIADTIKINIIV